MAELHETLMGRKLIEHTLPEIAIQLKRIADSLDNKESKKLDNLYNFMEVIEGLTTDSATAHRIGLFLTQQGIWEKRQEI